MTQKLKRYQVKRAVPDGYSELGEQKFSEATFEADIAISVSTGSTYYSNLIITIQSTHNGVLYEDKLKAGDKIIDGDTFYVVDYVYPALGRYIALLTKDDVKNG